jgi:hypothetical protein
MIFFFGFFFLVLSAFLARRSESEFDMISEDCTNTKERGVKEVLLQLCYIIFK